MSEETKEIATPEISTGEQREKNETETAETTHDQEITDTSSTNVENNPEEVSYNIDPEVIEKLSVGVLEHCLPDLQKAKSSLDEILQNQNVLIETIQQENKKFTDCKAMDDLTDTMIKSRKYYTKLMNLKKEMAVVSEKSFKLKKRAVKLQQQTQKEELIKAQQREKEMEKERMLTAKIAKKPSHTAPV